ncbi:uncharacterized protein PAC_16332 [Phialocephala subalpina]|uniref:Uncharacterized protein n=1 Tax=Phialocephala subalpina TaxID=576137 RepID=A0A1L7XMZ0_9HELO|nr:uncharacterized protein PAC_16332 [Phialocephala subalpina]
MASLLATPVSAWADACATNIINSNVTTGLVNQYGQPMSEFTNYTWGIDQPTCYQYCGKDKIYQVFNFNNFANDFTSWLLPWLSLTAQLPFQARSSKGNLMSLYMAVGSPALITYSLTITILNRNWVRRKFETLREELGDLRDKDLRQKIGERLQAAQYLLQESQQVPMRTSQVGGWLSSLITLEQNEAWWKRVKKDLQNSRRGYTFSLVAQIGMALIAYTFTIAIILSSSPLGISEGANIELTAGGGLWIWMIPVIWGWIMCGTQDRPHSITEALNDETNPAFRINESGEVKASEMQRGICSRSGLIPRPRLLELQTVLRSTSTIPTETVSGTVKKSEMHSGLNGDGGEEIIGVALDESSINETPSASDDKKHASDSTVMPITLERPLGDFPKEEYKELEVPSWLGFSIEGDEAVEGPIFNYARLFTFREFSSAITKAFQAHISSLAAGKSRKGNIFEVAESCSLDKRLLQAYTPWRKTDPTVWYHILIAAGAAIFVQWGTTGPAIMMAYLTPTVGLGCRSGGYLLYGVGATISWALITWSFLLSHAVNLRYQDIYTGRRESVHRKENNDPEEPPESQEMLLTDQSDQNSEPIINLSKYRRTRWHSTLVILTVTTRAAGKCIAAANACWVVISAIFEYTGVYSQCWCDTNADVMGNRGWVVLFATNESFQAVAKASWVGGVIFSFGVCFFAWVGFLLGCRRSDIDEYDY